jgi:hypothetical protein
MLRRLDSAGASLLFSSASGARDLDSTTQEEQSRLLPLLSNFTRNKRHKTSSSRQ